MKIFFLYTLGRGKDETTSALASTLPFQQIRSRHLLPSSNHTRWLPFLSPACSMLPISLIHFSQTNVSTEQFRGFLKYLKCIKTSGSDLQMWRKLEQLGTEVKDSSTAQRITAATAKLLEKNKNHNSCKILVHFI